MITYNYNCLGYCPTCKGKGSNILTSDKPELNSGDEVFCAYCDALGIVETHGGDAWVDWDFKRD